MVDELRRNDFDLLEYLEALFLEAQLTGHQQRAYEQLLRRSLIEGFKHTGPGVVLYFHNGRRIQFQTRLLRNVLQLLDPWGDESRAAANCAILRGILGDQAV